jgi:hypothetical protein
VGNIKTANRQNPEDGMPVLPQLFLDFQRAIEELPTLYSNSPFLAGRYKNLTNKVQMPLHANV